MSSKIVIQNLKVLNVGKLAECNAVFSGLILWGRDFLEHNCEF